jgi:class 3 adenylate cyclase/tetratricopeptide (TPR) repeat protein
LPGEFPFCPFCAAPLAAQAAAAEERKVVSVLFCDLVGFTASSETADPEDVRARLRPYHTRLREEIERFGGTVEKFVGDAVMAVFGAPVAHEDDAERAVRAGLRILEAIAELNESDPGFDLQVRIGINTGEAVVALGARPELGEGIVTGDVVNTASRIQGAAPIDGVAVSEPTHRATEREFDYEPLDPVTVKGKTEPLILYRPLRARADLGREVTRSHATPLVGRDLERSLLIGTFDRATQQRSCQLVTLVGEPGVGKSRLCMELARHVDAQRGLTRWRQGRCLPYGDGIAFWALGEIVKAECGILESDSPQAAEAKLEDALPDDDPDRAWLKARLAPLVGVPAEPASQEESFEAWRRVLESWAVGRETVLVFEDLHWADDALLSFLEHLADWAEGIPLLVLCTARPELFERNPTFGANARNAQRVNLSPLTDNETARLIGSLLERTLLPEETQQTLLERAGGNPLYAEEFVRLLGDRGEAVEVPESVQALIAARLDTLSPERKSLLQDAAVVGKVFWTGALAEMGGRDTREVEQSLHELSRKELVRPFRTTSMDGEAEFGFWHVLVCDVAYGQIPRAARADKHLAVAAWLERVTGERAADLADVLAHHYLQAFELARAGGDTALASSIAPSARRHLVLAGERALGLDAAQAEVLLRRARDLCSEDDAEWPELVRLWAEAAAMLGKFMEIESVAERALGACRLRGDRVLAARLLGVLTGCSLELGRADYMRLGAETVAMLEAEQPGRPLVVAYAGQAQLNLMDGHPEEAVRLADKAYELAVNLGIPPVRGLGTRGVARTVLGETEGLADMERALALALDADQGREAQFLLGHLAVIGYPIEGSEVALAAFDRAIAFSRTRGFRRQEVFCETNRAGVLLDSGLPDEALAVVARIAAEVEASGDIRTLLELRGVESIVAAERGRSADALADADWIAEAVVSSRAMSDCAWGHPAAAALAHLRDGNSTRAVELLQIVEQLPTVKRSYWYGIQLPRMVRIALAADRTELARWLAADVSAPYALNRDALKSCEAALAEAGGEFGSAAPGYADAAAHWLEFGNVPERSYALLGQGRCLIALGHAGAEVPLSEARDLFASMGYRPALAETEELLSRG